MATSGRPIWESDRSDRRTSGETVMAEQKFAEFTEAMVATIPPDTEPDMREKLESLYRFANEPSLKQRLRSIVASLTDAFGEAPRGRGRDPGLLAPQRCCP